MSNLDIEGLSKIVQTGDVNKLMGGAGPASEVQTSSVMKAEGLHASPIADGKSFSDVLRSSVDQVNHDQQQADTAIKELVSGRTKNIHETMLTIERADTSLKLMMQVRNKILDAYKEIMHMQV